MKVINDWFVSCSMKKDIKVLKDPITKKPIHPVTFADGIYLNNGTRLEDNLRYLFSRVSVIGDLEELLTNKKDNLVDALNEVFKDSDKPLYGVRFSGTKPEGIRLGNAENMNAYAYYGSGTYAPNDFDNIYPWSDIKRCLISDDGIIWAYEGEPGFTLSPSIGNIFVEIPKFYQKIVYENDTLDLMISPYKREGYSLNPAFIDNKGKELPFIYIGAYEASCDGNRIHSKSDKIINGVTLNQMKDMVKNKGKDFKLIDIYERSVIELLFCIEYATLDSQSIFKGKNIIKESTKVKTGESDVYLDYPSYTIMDSDKHSFRYRYMENLWGSAGEIIDGISIENFAVKLMEKELYSYSPDSKDSFIAERTLEGIPTLSDKQSSNKSYFCDYMSLPKDDKQKLYIVGHPHVLENENQELSSLGNGLFSVSMNFNIDDSSDYITSRLVYKQQK